MTSRRRISLFLLLVTLVVLPSMALAARLDVDAISAEYAQAILQYSSIDRLVARYDGSASIEGYLTAAYLQWKHGQIDEAIASADHAVGIRETTDGALLKARLLDAKGNEQQAAAWYRKALASTDNEGEREFIRLRLTMIDVDEQNVDGLVDLAYERDQAFRNRSAVALALLGRADLAVELFRPISEEVNTFQQHVRRVEWALAAKNLKQAQEFAWDAYQETNSRVDSLYALTLLVEAYRKADALQTLIDHLETVPEPNDDLLRLRVDLLIETEQYDAAIKLYKGPNGSDASVDSRTRLVKLYEAAGQTGEMVAEYKTLMESEPGVVLWYSGLAGHYMNIAAPEEALEVWRALESRNAGSISALIAAGDEMASMGFIDEAKSMIERYLSTYGADVQGLMFLFEMALKRGQDTEALAGLRRLEESLPPGSGDIRLVADAYERLNKYDQAIRVFEELREDGSGLGYDERMRLAWLYSVVGRKQEALNAWREIWVSVDSPARRSFAEAQFLMLSAELGTIAEIVVELEDKLYRQTADKNEMLLLVRIYSEVGDSFSASEVVEEYARYTQQSEVEKLGQLGKVYLQLSEFSKYDKVLRRLEKIDTENRVEHIQNLILNMLAFDIAESSRHRFDEIHHWLGELRSYAADAVSGEFEASVLTMGGFAEEAIESYRRALVEKPEHVDNLLLMSDLLKEVGRTDEAVAMLQFVAEHADTDNEFVVAIDGVINMVGQRTFGQELAPELQSIFRWTQRVILERIAARDDKFYLYSLLAEIAQETSNQPATFAAVENSLSQAGVRRTAVLRELVTMSTPGAGFGLADANIGDLDRQITYGRRLIGLRQHLPPEVYITLGKSLLEQGDIQGAENAFDLINDITGLIDVDRTKADLYKEAGYSDKALTHYNRALSVNRDDLELLLSTAVLRESRGQDDIANSWYLHALTTLLKSQPFVIKGAPPKLDNPLAVFRPVVDTSVNRDYRTYYEMLAQGFLITWPKDTAVAEKRGRVITEMFDSELSNVVASFEGSGQLPLAKYSRLSRISQFLRRLAAYTGNIDLGRHTDRALIEHFYADSNYVNAIASAYRNWGDAEFAALIVSKAGIENESASAASLHQIALERAVDKGDVELAVKLAKLSENHTALEVVFRHQIDAGNFRVGLGYARAMLTKTRFRQFAASAVPAILGNRRGLAELLVSDPELLRYTEELLNRELLPIRDIATLLDLPAINQILSISIGAESGIWGFVKSKTTIDERIEFLKHHVAGRAKGPQEGAFGAYTMIRDLMAGSLTETQQEELFKTTTSLLSRENSSEGSSRGLMPQLVLQPGTHPDNRSLVHDLLDYWQSRRSDDVDYGPLVHALHTGKDNEALRLVLELERNGVLGLNSWELRTWIDTQFRASFDRALGELARGEYSDAALARQLYEIEYRPRSWRDAAPAELRKWIALQRTLAGQFTSDLRYRRELITTLLLLGDSADVERELEGYYELNPGDEYMRTALFFHLVGSQKFDRALEIAMDGGPDLRDGAIVADLLDRSEAEQRGVAASSASILKTILGSNTAVRPGPVVYTDDIKQYIERLRKSATSATSEQLPAVLRAVWRGINTTIAKSQQGHGPNAAADLLANLPLTEKTNAGQFYGQTESLDVRIQPLTAMIDQDAGEPEQTLVESLATRKWVAQELESYLRALPDDTRRTAFSLYKLTASAYTQSDSTRRRLGDLTRRLGQGEIDEHELTLWMLLRVEEESALSGGEAQDFGQRLLVLGSATELQLLSAARVFALANRFDDAVDYYKLLAARLIRHREFENPQQVFRGADIAPVASLQEVILDISRRLPRDYAQRLVAEIVSIAARADNEAEFEHYYNAFALRSFATVYAPAETIGALAEFSSTAVEFSRGGSASGHYLVALAEVQARSGDSDAAINSIRALLTPSKVSLTDSESSPGNAPRSYRVRQGLRNLAALYGLPNSGNSTDFADLGNRAILVAAREGLFPATPDGAAWRDAARTGLLKMLDDNTVERAGVIEALLTLAYQTSQAGADKAAKEIIFDVGSWVVRNSGSVEPLTLRDLAAMTLFLDAILPIDLITEILAEGRLSVGDEVALLAAVARSYSVDEALKLGREFEAGKLGVMTLLANLADEAGEKEYAIQSRKQIAGVEGARRELNLEARFL